MQSKKNSLIEVITTSASKWVVMTFAQILYFRVYKGFDVTLVESMEWATLAFILSVILSFLFRRMFNRLHAGRVDTA